MSVTFDSNSLLVTFTFAYSYGVVQFGKLHVAFSFKEL